MIPKELFKRIKRLEIRMKGLVANLFGGEYHSAFKGRGMEFVEVRPYQIGDEIRSIDWNVSARTGETFVKVFQEEREQTLMLAVDISGSGEFGSQGMMKREMAAEICAVLAFSAIQNNDKVGLLLFSDEIELFVPPKKGRTHVLRIVRDLYAHQPRSRKTSLSIALEHLLHVLKRRSIVVLISDFYDTQFEKQLRIITQKHDTVAVHVTDEREKHLPSIGLLSLTDAESGRPVVVDTRSRSGRQLYTSFARARQQALEDLFKRTRLDVIEVQTGSSYIEPLVQFFRTRTRRMAR